MARRGNGIAAGGGIAPHLAPATWGRTRSNGPRRRKVGQGDRMEDDWQCCRAIEKSQL